MVLTVPAGVIVPGDSVSKFTLVCDSGCTNDSGAVFSWSKTLRELTITKAFDNYLPGGTKVDISITGWTNPSDTLSYAFSIATFAQIGIGSAGKYGIEKFTGNMSIKAISGVCNV